MQAVGHGAGSIHLEHICEALGAEGVQHEDDVVVGALVSVPHQGMGRDLGRIRIVADEADIEGVAAAQQQHLGVIGRGLARMGALLGEVLDHAGLLPGGFIQVAVHLDGTVVHPTSFDLGSVVLSEGRQAESRQQGHQDSVCRFTPAAGSSVLHIPWMSRKAKRFYDLIQIVTIFFREPSCTWAVTARPPTRTKKLFLE